MNIRKRFVAHLCVGYGSATILAHTFILAGVAVARVLRGDPRVPGPGIRNLRTVDDRLWVGSQPDKAAYRALAICGVSTVVNLREGTTADPVGDDPCAIARLGMRYVAIPIRDGCAPQQRDVAAFAQALDESPGITYMHCAAGVGRSTSLQMAYLAGSGRPYGVLDQLAVGPSSIEQIAFVASLRKRGGGVPPHLALLSRVVDAPRRALGWARRLVPNVASRLPRYLGFHVVRSSCAHDRVPRSLRSSAYCSD